jgi:hypothetical protein
MPLDWYCPTVWHMEPTRAKELMEMIENDQTKEEVEQNVKKKPRHTTADNILHWFTYHPPANESQKQHYEAIREAGKEFAMALLQHTPSCPDQTVAIRRVREAVMIANAAIACEGR